MIDDLVLRIVYSPPSLTSRSSGSPRATKTDKDFIEELPFGSRMFFSHYTFNQKTSHVETKVYLPSLNARPSFHWQYHRFLI